MSTSSGAMVRIARLAMHRSRRVGSARNPRNRSCSSTLPELTRIANSTTAATLSTSVRLRSDGTPTVQTVRMAGQA